jgi:hypothetical protein
MREEPVVAYSKALSQHLPVGTGKIIKKLIWISSLLANIQTMKWKQSRCDNIYIMTFDFTEQTMISSNPASL